LAKIVLLVLGLLFVYWILKGYRRRVDRGERKPPATAGEDMVQCAQCGVHLPRSESITTQGRFFCSADHQRAHQSAGRPG
jgi:uncharacterized protein